MVYIADVHAVPALGGFYFDDQQAIQRDVNEDGFVLKGTPRTPGFKRVREPGEALLIMIELTDGRFAYGDCAAVVYSGVAGRDPLFRGREYVDTVEGSVRNVLVGRDAATFATNTSEIEGLDLRDGERLHTALQYGLSQALLDAAAKTRRTTKANVLAEHHGTTLASEPVPIYAQSGPQRYEQSDKMILKEVDVLPHASIHNREEIGPDGERLLSYVEWLAERVTELGTQSYNPSLHIDVYGQIGDLFGEPYDRPEVVDYIRQLSTAAVPYSLTIESPIQAKIRARQLDAMASLRTALANEAIAVDLAADEWCNTLDDVEALVDAGAADLIQVKAPDLGSVRNSVEAILTCRGTGTNAFLGGSVNETDLSARASVHVALASGPAFVMAKPGLGVDAGVMIVQNEMERTLRRHEIMAGKTTPTDC